MVSAVRHGASIRAVARQFHVDHTTVMRWVHRTEGGRLDRADLADGSSCPHTTQRTSPKREALILEVRRALANDSDLGEYGAEAIHRELRKRRARGGPSPRTIGRVLERCGALDGRRRTRRPAPPRGWYLPEVAAHRAELDSFDVIEDLRLQDGPLLDVLTTRSLHGGLAGAWATGASLSASVAVSCMVRHWRTHGLPAYVQFDNDTRFQGPHQHRHVLSRVMRLCLSLGVIPVFVPPYETGFQGMIENFNGRWQQKVWNRFHHRDLAELRRHSGGFVRALRRRCAGRPETAPPRRPFPQRWTLDLQRPPQGPLIYIRRLAENGRAFLLGESFFVSRRWQGRLVRCEVDLDHHGLRFFALRRRAPKDQPLLKKTPFRIHHRPFRE